MKFVSIWNQSSAQLNPHLKTLSSADDKLISLITICVMFQSILPFSVFKEVNRAHLYCCIWRQARAENNQRSDLDIIHFIPTMQCNKLICSSYHHFHKLVCLWNHHTCWYWKLTRRMRPPALLIPVWFQSKYFPMTYFKSFKIDMRKRIDKKMQAVILDG